MDIDNEMKITPPKKFPFPFVPYSIQDQFMTSLYEAIENRNIGIFESPTGMQVYWFWFFLLLAFKLCVLKVIWWYSEISRLDIWKINHNKKALICYKLMQFFVLWNLIQKSNLVAGKNSFVLNIPVSVFSYFGFWYLFIKLGSMHSVQLSGLHN